MTSQIPVTRNRSERGFSLIMIGACSVVMLGMMGLTTDLGRVYIAKNELQSFVDASSVAAALQLDGTSAGVTQAGTAAASGPVGPSSAVNSWYFATKTVPAPTVTYSTTFTGTYNPAASADPNSRFVIVEASAPVPIYFMSVVPGVSSTMTVAARATAGLAVKTTITAGGANGLAPFAPYALNPVDLNFGFTKGSLYTLRGTPSGGMDSCPGDVAHGSFGNGSQERGYIDVGQGNGNSSLADPLVNGVTYPGVTYAKDSAIPFVPGQKHVGPDIHDRFWQDTDTVQIETYSAYTGNGRRILLVPVADAVKSNAAGAAWVAGFAAFFLQNDFTSLNGNTDPLCAEYIGTATLGSSNPGPTHGSTDQYYAVQLFK